MKVLGGIMSVIATITLALTFVVAGVAVCMAPPMTHALSSMFADDATSPFSRAQLVQVADATREYSFGNHDELVLRKVIHRVDSEYADAIGNMGGKLPSDFPKVDRVTDVNSLSQLKSSCDGASQMYCFSTDTISHLDDCYRIASFAFPVVIVIAALALVALVFTGVVARKRRVGGVLLAAGIAVIVAFVGLGVWAILDFQGFFGVFHGLFFSQGNWQFPYDSLLICALPTTFWTAMLFICIAVAAILSVVSILIGAVLVSRRR